MAPFIPQKVVGFTGIDPGIVSSGSGGDCTCTHDLSDEQREQVEQMLAQYIATLPVNPDEIPHNELKGLQGGQSGEYNHLTNEELQRLQALIAATFPPGSIVPVFPGGSGGSGGGGGSGSGDSGGEGGSETGDEDPTYDPFGGLPPTMSADWTAEPFRDKNGAVTTVYTAYADAGSMYYGTFPVTNSESSTYIVDALVVPVTKSATYKQVLYTTDLNIWY